jgi:hypothetical protein
VDPASHEFGQDGCSGCVQKPTPKTFRKCDSIQHRIESAIDAIPIAHGDRSVQVISIKQAAVAPIASILRMFLNTFEQLKGKIPCVNRGTPWASSSGPFSGFRQRA